MRDKYKPHPPTLLGLLNIKLSQIPRENKYSLGALRVFGEKVLICAGHSDMLSLHTLVGTLHLSRAGTMVVSRAL